MPRGIKILWWLAAPSPDPLEITIRSTDSVVVGSATFDPPGPLRQGRPSGIGMPPPSCYRIDVRIGTKTGEIVDRVSGQP